LGSLAEQLGQEVVDLLMLGDGVAGVVAQVRLGEHGRVERFLLRRGMGGDLDAEGFEQFPPFRAVALGLSEAGEQIAVAVVVGLEIGEDAGVGHEGSFRFASQPTSPPPVSRKVTSDTNVIWKRRGALRRM
jgi:hypothetical protein